MMASARIYNCARCARQVVLCSHCDRGNIYCFEGCADVMRQQSLNEAGKRYQDTLQGRTNHARRQAEYRIRQALMDCEDSDPAESVTHHGFAAPCATASMESDELRCKPEGVFHCHCCGRGVDPWLRRGYLRHAPSTSLHSSSFQPQA